MTGTTVTVRMYDVGFGDCLLITIRSSAGVWRMLVDCGSHSLGRARPLKEVVQQVVRDIAEDGDSLLPHLDVIVATHRHADHIQGFTEPEWSTVQVGEVWLPYVEDENDEQGDALRRRIEYTAAGLNQSVTLAAAAGGNSETLRASAALTANARPNQQAMDRLLGINGTGFRGTHRVEYWPKTDAARNTHIPHHDGNPLPDTRIHVFGPPRDPSFLKTMNPPARAEWFHLSRDSPAPGGHPGPLFASDYETDWRNIHPGADAIKRRHGLRTLNDYDSALLSAAVRLERVLNNTSLFIVIEVGHLVVVLPGDAQQGAWEHVRANPQARRLLSNCTVYKIGHHGSHNATPRAFLEEDWASGGGYALLPWGSLKIFGDIPKTTLMDAIGADHQILRNDVPVPPDQHTTVAVDQWIEVRYEL